MADSTKLFSNRVAEYIKARPGYPSAIIDLLATECGMIPDWNIADLGSGTGNLTRLFLENGNTVYGVEPNLEMREAAERTFEACKAFRSVDGRSEATTLESGSIDLVSAGQAFHWFDPIPTQVECRRILQPEGWCALVWNVRRHDASRFMEQYEQILTKQIPTYGSGKGRTHGAENIEVFFGHLPAKATFSHSVDHTWDSLSNLVLSTSYAPKEGQPGHEELMAAFRDCFEREESNGKVQVAYDTEVFYGRLGRGSS